MMKYIIITPNRFDDVIKYLRYTFFADEPLNKALQLCKPGEGHAESEKYSRETLAEGLSVMAVTDDDEVLYSELNFLCRKLMSLVNKINLYQQIAGVALNSVVRCDSKKAALNELDDQPDEKFKKIFNLLYSQNLRVNLFKEFDVDELFEVTILSVNPKFRGQGIAKHLLVKSEEIARQNGFKVRKKILISKLILCDFLLFLSGHEIGCNWFIFTKSSSVSGIQTMFRASL